MLSKIPQLQQELSKISGQVALAFSHQIEDTIALFLLLKSGFDKNRIEVFTLNTHKLFKESLEYQKNVESHFDIKIKEYSAPLEKLESLEKELGEWGMRDSIESRKKCCNMRKILPLKEALNGKEAWISGLRAAQSVTRADISFKEWDSSFNLIKFNPLFDVGDKQMWEFVESQNLPKNALYEKNFLSIGCQPCTRAVKEGEDIRAGRWWWENPEHKECGLHLKK